MEQIAAFPGQRICLASETTVPGLGSYERNGYIYSSIAGVIETEDEGNNKIINVLASGQKTVLPVVGDVVTARVELLNQRFAKCQILCVNDQLLTRPLRGILRKEDVRATDIDGVEMYKNYRPNDIILAKIIPQVELHTYSLSTAENELGVVIARPRCSIVSSNSTAVNPMVPISWKLMKCPITGVEEPRKVAKIMSEDSLIRTAE